MTILSNINYFKELPFYYVPIKKTKIKRLETLVYYMNYLFMIN